MGVLQRVTLAILMCSIACYEGSSERQDAGEAAGHSTPENAQPRARAKSRPDSGSAPAELCPASASLSAWCERNVCPVQLSAAHSSLCENEIKRSLTAEELAPKHERAANSCRGESVTHFGRDVRTRYDFEANGVLIGVTVFDPVAFSECADGSQTYGKACSITGEAARLCAVLCPAIACNAGLSIQVDAAEPASSYENAELEVCLNDSCKTGRLTAMIGERPSSGSGVGVYNDTLSNGLAVNLTLWGNLPEQYFELNLSSYDPAKLHDGDRFVFRLTLSDGRALLDLHDTVDTYEIFEVGAPCTQYCPRKTYDLRIQRPRQAAAP